MRSNELRINNLVNTEKGKITIDQIIKCYVKYGEPEYYIIPIGNFNIAYNICDISPILLTEEWLLRLGFKDFSSDNNRMAYIFHVNSLLELASYNIETGIRFQTIRNGIIFQMEHIKYVHEIQNLYFALTGEELICS